MEFFCADIIRNYVSLWTFAFLIHVLVFSYENLPVCHLKYMYILFSTHISFIFIFLSFCLSLCCEWYYPIYPTPPLGQDMTQGQFLSGV